ncbi:MAG TPA: ParB N-terminal domain-containing protein [Clostridiaceae bacterium]|jgi:hypothetical protein|nr:ParB N-terminal domain-containing protein [Clostridiaceae bacterium]
MTDSKILIRGIPEKLPKITKKGDAILVFKTTGDKIPTYNKAVQQSYYMVQVKKKFWNNVSREIKETTYYIIEGIPRASVTSKKLPFISILCSNIKVVNGLERDESNPGRFKFPGKLPFDTDEVIPISSINIPKNLQKPKTAMVKALNYFKAHGTFYKPMVVKKGNMNLVSGYENYLLAKELNIEMVPVSYNLTTGAPSKDEIKFRNIVWYKPEEVTEVNVKDIILTEDIHLNVQNFIFSINLKELSNTGNINVPVAIRPVGEGKYSLVSGVARYFAAKILDIEKIPAIITNMSHDEFVETRFAQYSKINDNNKQSSGKKKSKGILKIEGETSLSIITIPESFARTKPNPAKIKETVEYYKKHGKFDKPVVIRGDTNLLIDGYKRYVAAKELGLESIWTIKLK